MFQYLRHKSQLGLFGLRLYNTALISSKYGGCGLINYNEINKPIRINKFNLEKGIIDLSAGEKNQKIP